MSELDRVIARLREDASFAHITVKRDGDNLKSWIPPLSKAEIKKAVQAASEAHQIEPSKPRTEPRMSRAEREAQAHGERVAAALRAKDARDRAAIQKKRDERARTWQLRGCKFLGLHKWNGCTCAVCAATRDADHDWSGCRCVRCRAIRDVEHKWDGCRCLVCTTTRDQDHVFDGCKCTKCFASRDQDHEWQGCRCARCGASRDQDHEWEYSDYANRIGPGQEWRRECSFYVCKKCGKSDPRPRYSSPNCFTCGQPVVGSSFWACRLCRSRFHKHCKGHLSKCPKCGIDWLPQRR